VGYLDRTEMVNPIIQIVDNLEGSGVGKYAGCYFVVGNFQGFVVHGTPPGIWSGKPSLVCYLDP
jgi:hypothetical protein